MPCNVLILGSLLITLLSSLLQPRFQTSSEDVLTFTPTPFVVDAAGGVASRTAGQPIALQVLLKIPTVLTAGVPFTIMSTWSNDGDPLDNRWEVVYQLRNNDASVIEAFVSETELSDLLLTNSPSVVDEFWLSTDVQVGSYTMNVLVRDPADERSPLALAMAGVQPDGSYLLGSVDVVGGDTVAPSLATTVYLPLSTSGDPTDTRALHPTITSVVGVVNNAVLSGRVYIGVETRGSIDRVEFRLDGAKTATWIERGAPWWFMGNDGDDRTGWDTTIFPDGAYALTITAIGHDNRSVRTERTFTVANQSHPADSAIGRNGVFIAPARVQAIRQAVSERRAPNYAAYQRLLDECDDAVREAPSPPRTLAVPNFYEDPTGHGRAKRAVKNDANNAYALALCYRITGNETFARAAVRIISSWSTTLTQIETRDDAALVWSYHFPAMIFAADLLRGAPLYTPEIDQAFIRFLRVTALPGSTMHTVSRVGCGYLPGVPLTNNWSNWGIVLSMSIGVFTGDTRLYTESVQKWQHNVDIQIDEQGNLPIEGRRNDCSGDTGLHYTNYAMQPLTIAAEIAANNGTNLYQDERYQRAVHRTVEVNRYPSRFSFFRHRDNEYVDMRYKVAWLEVARNYIADANADWLLQQFRPVATPEVIRYATLTHGNLQVRPTGVARRNATRSSFR